MITNMKKNKLIIVLLFFLIVLIGCSGNNYGNNPTETNNPKINPTETTSNNPTAPMTAIKEITTYTETTKLGNTFVLIDIGLDKKEISDYIKTFDLSEIKRIEFRNNWKFNDGWYIPYNIYIFNMKYGLQKDGNWKYTFKHEYSHHYCYINFNDLSEECANKYQVTW